MSERDRHEQRRALLAALGGHVQARVLAARNAAAPGEMARVAHATRADVIYAVDTVSENAIEEWFAAHWPEAEPVQLVMEGIEDDETRTFPPRTPPERLRWKCLLDPIDGTRNLMYDKRSAWVMIGLAPYRGAANVLSDISVAAMTELPPSKQLLADRLSVVRGAGPEGVVAERVHLETGAVTTWTPRPSSTPDLNHGFASISRFLPAAKERLAAMEEQLWRSLGSRAEVVFEDQYISTGGQFYQLLAGHDRMLADLRPEALASLGKAPDGAFALVCHPYDVAAWLVATELGVVLEKPDGSPLDQPLDTTTPVSWVGYANADLAALIRPKLTEILSAYATPDTMAG